ncbi:MAG: serine/threonine-protein kinase [Pirellulaceae bacterium]
MDALFAEFVSESKRRNEPLPIHMACDWIRQAADAIAHAHSIGVLHRDLKPANIMLDKSGQIRVLDLGLAKLSTNKSDKGKSERKTELTRHEQVIGTPSFMAPEQLQESRTVTEQVDVYSLGATLFYLLTGKTVYSEKGTILQRGLAILNDPVPDIGTLRPELPEALTELVTRCIAKRPDDRIKSAEELSRLLHPFCRPPLDKHTVAVAANETLPRRKVNFRNWRWAIAVSGLMLISVLIAMIVMRFQLPNGGELVIECDDPNAQITFSILKDGEQSPLSVSLDKHKHLTLSEGTWVASITGVDADGFRLESNRIEMIRGGTVTIRILRHNDSSGTVVENVTATTGTDSDEPMVTDLDSAKSQTHAEDVGSLFPELGQQDSALASIDWTKVGTSRQLGLLPTWQPVQEGSDLSWQLRPWLETVGPHLGDPASWLADLDPTGKFLGVVTEADAKVMELETGRITHSIPAPTNSRWHAIRLSADADRVVLSDSINYEVRDRRNRIVSQWSYQETDWFQKSVQKSGAYFIVHTLASWCVPGESLLLFSDQVAFVIDIYGNLIQEVSDSRRFRPVSIQSYECVTGFKNRHRDLQ